MIIGSIAEGYHETLGPYKRLRVESTALGTALLPERIRRHFAAKNTEP